MKVPVKQATNPLLAYNHREKEGIKLDLTLTRELEAYAIYSLWNNDKELEPYTIKYIRVFSNIPTTISDSKVAEVVKKYIEEKYGRYPLLKLSPYEILWIKGHIGLRITNSELAKEFSELFFCISTSMFKSYLNILGLQRAAFQPIKGEHRLLLRMLQAETELLKSTLKTGGAFPTTFMSNVSLNMMTKFSAMDPNKVIVPIPSYESIKSKRRPQGISLKEYWEGGYSNECYTDIYERRRQKETEMAEAKRKVISYAKLASNPLYPSPQIKEANMLAFSKAFEIKVPTTGYTVLIIPVRDAMCARSRYFYLCLSDWLLAELRAANAPTHPCGTLCRRLLSAIIDGTLRGKVNAKDMEYLSVTLDFNARGELIKKEAYIYAY